MIACGALVREFRSVIASNRWTHLEVAYLPAHLHNRPDGIVPRIVEVLDRRPDVERVLIGYADCGTGGLLDTEIEALRSRRGLDIERLPGNHCYEFFTGTDDFVDLHEEELGTLFLTDYLARHFDLLIWQGMGLDDHPELLPLYFGNYRRLVLLTQTSDASVLAELTALAEAAAERLGLEFVLRPTGLGPFDRAVAATHVQVAASASQTVTQPGVG